MNKAERNMLNNYPKPQEKKHVNEKEKKRLNTKDYYNKTTPY